MRSELTWSIDGGLALEAKVNGKEVCSSKAVYGGPGHERVGEDGKKWATIAETTPCPNVIPLKKGDKLNLEARYDLDAHPLRHSARGEMSEVMALLVVSFAED